MAAGMDYLAELRRSIRNRHAAIVSQIWTAKQQGDMLQVARIKRIAKDLAHYRMHNEETFLRPHPSELGMATHRVATAIDSYIDVCQAHMAHGPCSIPLCADCTEDNEAKRSAFAEYLGRRNDLRWLIVTEAA